MHACFALVAALLASSPGASYSFSRPPRALGRSRDAAVAGVSMRASLEDRAMENAVSTAAVAAAAVSKAVSMKELEAPDLDRSFIALDSAASSEGLVDEAGLPLVYNKELIEAYWTKERGALQARWSEFLRYSVPFLTRVVTLLIRGGTDELMKNDKSLAREAREIMEQLGPTYVKLGQVLSVRPDILPQAALDELAILQDSVRPFETALAVEMIERELGGPLNNFFSEISEEPVAAASLAQVYKAKLAKPSQKKRLKNKTKSVKKIEVVAGDEMGTASEEEGGAAVVGETEAVEEGEEEEFEEEEERAEYVAVKVQRPAVLELVSKDLYVLRRAAEVYQGLIERFAPQQRTDYVALLNEWAVGFYTEFDFTNEARNQDLVKDLMQQQGVTDVYIPDTYAELTTRKVLVSEWVDGRKLSDCDPAEIRDLIKVGQETFLTQLLQVGVFHSDPHPGNLLRLDDDAAARVGARLCLLVSE
jgi:aarF domain-containing kinase